MRCERIGKHFASFVLDMGRIVGKKGVEIVGVGLNP